MLIWTFDLLPQRYLALLININQITTSGLALRVNDSTVIFQAWKENKGILKVYKQKCTLHLFSITGCLITITFSYLDMFSSCMILKDCKVWKQTHSTLLHSVHFSRYVQCTPAIKQPLRYLSPSIMECNNSTLCTVKF